MNDINKKLLIIKNAKTLYEAIVQYFCPTWYYACATRKDYFFPEISHKELRKILLEYATDKLDEITDYEEFCAACTPRNLGSLFNKY